MNLIKKRRQEGAVCPRCKSPDYEQQPADIEGGKLNFKCKSCGSFWQYGRTGGKYAELSKDNLK